MRDLVSYSLIHLFTYLLQNTQVIFGLVIHLFIYYRTQVRIGLVIHLVIHLFIYLSEDRIHG